MAELLEDGTLEFLLGQDASKKPSRVKPGAIFSAVNVTFRDGILGPRFGIEEKTLNFNIDSRYTLPTGFTRSYEDIFYSGRFQALIPYMIGTETFLLIVVSGIIYLVNQTTFEVSLIEIDDGSTISESHARVNWSPAGRFLVIFDFPAYPVILEGFTARRADPAQLEIPVSVLGAYNQNRLFISNLGNEFTASDPAAYGFPDGPVSFTEILTPAGPFFGQTFQLSTNYTNDSITAMAFLQVIDTSTGIGPLLVSTQNSIWSYQTQRPRNQWEAAGFGAIFIPDVGIAGPRSMVNLNSDLYFVASDGQIRSASMSRDSQTKWSKAPISNEVKNFIKLTNPELIKYSVMSYFKNTIFATVNPYYTVVQSLGLKPMLDYAFGGMVLLELDNISTLGKDSPPAWAGLNTCARVMDINVNNNECFIMAKELNKNALFKVRPDRTYDVVGSTKDIRPVKSKVYTAEYNFKSPMFNKALHSIDFNLQGVKGEFTMKVKYKPSHSPTFLDWREFKHTAPWRLCDSLPEGCEWNGLAGHDFRELNLGSPFDVGCNPLIKEEYDVFRTVQILLEIEGIDWEIEAILVRATALAQNTTESVCEQYPVVKMCMECNKDWEIPEVCHSKTQMLN